MARPRSTSKAPQQRGAAGQGKRKHGAAPQGGGAGGRPAKLSRREDRSKPIDNDVFEAEDSDPDEVKHSERFDQVDNYEYELPSDFEDEEIDEDLAFTEEDKKKFGAWFGKEVSADEEEGVGVGDDDGEDWDEGDDEDDDAGDDEDVRGTVDDDEDVFLNDEGDEEDDEEEDEEGGLEDGDDDDDERHRAMLEEILDGVNGGGAASRKRARRDPNAAVVSEAYPESEYNLNPGAASAGGLAGSLSLADLLQGLTSEERRKLGTARKLLEKVAVGGRRPEDNDAEDEAAGGGKKRGKQQGPKGLRPVSVPLPSIVADRQERKAGYEAASEEVTKWQAIVKANREAPTLRLVSARQEVPRVDSTAAIVAQHTPSADNALEAEVAALLTAAGAHNTEAIEEAEEKLALKALTLEEARERRERLAKLRSLLFYHEVKARRLKQIKSKEYHRHLARASKRKAAKLAAATAEAGGEPGDVEAERVAAIEAEFQRAKERLTQRHRNSSRWARRALKRGQLQMDAGTKAALEEQLQLGQQLKRKIEGRKGSDDDDDSGASTSASDSEGEGGVDITAAAAGTAAARGSGRVRSAALELLAGGGPLGLNGEDAPKKGLLALPFMKRAMERRRIAAQQEAEDLLRELDEQRQEQEDGGNGEEDRRDIGGDRGGGGGGGKDILEALVGYGIPATAATAAGRRKFGAGSDAGDCAEGAEGRGVAGGEDDGEGMESDDAEDAEAKAERLGGRTPAATKLQLQQQQQQQQQQAAKGAEKRGGDKKGKGKAQAAAAAPPTAAELADLDAAIRAGAAGKGLLVTSADVGVQQAVAVGVTKVSTHLRGLNGGGGADDDDDEEGTAADASRRASGRSAGPRAGGAVLAEVAAHQASLAAGGGRAALFSTAGERPGGVGASAAEAAAGSGGGKAPKFMASKTFTGTRPGYAFKRGPQGLGYYLDKKAGPAAPPAAVAGRGGEVAMAGVGNEQKQGQQQQQEQEQQRKQQKQRQKDQQKQADGKGAPAEVTFAGQAKGQKNAAGKKQPGAATGAATAAAVAAVAPVTDDGDSDDDEAPLMRPVQQRDLIRQAFAGDDVEAEFAAEKAAAVAEELPDIEEPSTLPGWGAWAGQQRNPKWMQAAKDKAAKERAAAADGRKDANLKYVVISEKWDKKASKYTAPAAPFPFTSKEDYERSLRQPLGREYNPDTAFRDLTRPAVLKQAGVTIAPLRYSEPVAKELGKKGRKAETKRDERRVATVAGGMPRLGKN